MRRFTTRANWCLRFLFRICLLLPNGVHILKSIAIGWRKTYERETRHGEQEIRGMLISCDCVSALDLVVLTDHRQCYLRFELNFRLFESLRRSSFTCIYHYIRITNIFFSPRDRSSVESFLWWSVLVACAYADGVGDSPLHTAQLCHTTWKMWLEPNTLACKLLSIVERSMAIRYDGYTRHTTGMMRYWSRCLQRRCCGMGTSRRMQYLCLCPIHGVQSQLFLVRTKADINLPDLCPRALLPGLCIETRLQQKYSSAKQNTPFNLHIGYLKGLLRTIKDDSEALYKNVYHSRLTFQPSGDIAAGACAPGGDEGQAWTLSGVLQRGVPKTISKHEHNYTHDVPAASPSLFFPPTFSLSLQRLNKRSSEWLHWWENCRE